MQKRKGYGVTVRVTTTYTIYMKISKFSRNWAFIPVLHLDVARVSSTMNKTFIPSNETKKVPSVRMRGILDKKKIKTTLLLPTRPGVLTWAMLRDL